MPSSSPHVTQVADGVWSATGTDTNWVLLRDGSDVTLIDAGYPGDADAVEASVREIGARPEDVRALLITHAHVDHIGAAGRLLERYGVPAYTDAVEVGHAHRDHLEQANERDVVRNLWRPGALPWVLRIMRAGATKDVAVAHAQPFPAAGADGRLDLPGGPVPVATHGHTSGHTAYWLPQAGAVATGDGLVTAHALLRGTGPQLLPAFFNHGDVVAALDPLAALDADLVLPGHGDPLRRPIRDAVAEARGRVS
ncbi:MBL fold metallo-hydrolase [uncultured Jatrophihabitans sp.]|uniref:MBL fold metallo-hydrolase n=1 Tax=uncultured Jatrophihabitans sp. TaxID=1610747 RepID=UPI0035C9DD9D